MPWCPICKTEYQESIKRCDNCNIELVNEAWAKSTLAKHPDDPELCKVYELRSKSRCWLHEILDDNGIPYLIKIRSLWSGYLNAPEFSEIPCIYVEQHNRNTALVLINAYENAEAIKKEEMFCEEGSIPTIQCSFCGRDIDFDYPKCPFCNNPIPATL